MAFIIKPGTVLLTRGDGKYSKMIAHGVGDYYTHALWIRSVDGNTVKVQEALVSGKKKGVVTHDVDTEYYKDLYRRNKLKICDFNIDNNSDFFTYCNTIEGTPYDYLSVFTIAWRRFLAFFKAKPTDILFKSKKDKHAVDCSEMIARGLHHLKGINVLGILDKTEYDFVRPQEIAVLYDKWSMKNDATQG